MRGKGFQGLANGVRSKAAHSTAGFQAETFAKSITNGASVARRHFEKSVMLCLISNLATSRRRSILGFRLLFGVLQRFQTVVKYKKLILIIQN